jgi:hypothetical protein
LHECISQRKRGIGISQRPRILIIVLSGVVPLVYSLAGIVPSHDSKWRFELWMGYARSLILDNSFPSWFPITHFGINTALYNQYLDVTDYLTIFFMAVIHLNPSHAFSIYIFLNLLLLNLAFYYVARIAHVRELWTMCFVTLFSATYWSYWQTSWNLVLMNKYLIAICMIYYWYQNISLRKSLLLLLFNLAYLPYGGTPYLTISVYYIQLFLILILAFKKRHELARRILFSNQKKGRTENFIIIAYTGGLLFYVYVLICQFLLITEDVRFRSPNRSPSGRVSFETFINYGGYTGWEKFTSLIGNILEDQIVGRGSPDFQLMVGPLSVQLILFAMLLLRGKLLYLEKLLLFSIGLGIILFLPISMVWKAIYQVAPGISYIRHLSYLSVLILVPIALLTGSLLSRMSKHLTTNKIRMSFEVGAIAYTSLVVVLIWRPYIKRHAISLENPAIICASILFLVFLSYSSREGVSRKEFNKSEFSISAIFVFVGLSQSLLSYNIQIPIDDQRTRNYLVSTDMPYTESLPTVRTTSPDSLQDERWSVYSGGTYTTKSFVANRDYCKTSWRIDLESKVFNFNNVDIKSLEDSCELSKTSLYLDDSKLYMATRITKLTFNRVEVEYKLPSNISMDKDSKLHLIYRDAASLIDVWQAFDSNGKLLKISSSSQGFKRITLEMSSGTVIMVVKNQFVVLNTLKAIADVLIFWNLLFILIWRAPRSKLN